jgi:DeoR family transcriptional regulator of aga operon
VEEYRYFHRRVAQTLVAAIEQHHDKIGHIGSRMLALNRPNVRQEGKAMATARQLQILQHLTINGEISVHDLSELLDISPSTIRRELTIMEAGGLVIRTHGAAQLPRPIHYEPRYEERAALQVAEKRAIALAAKNLVEPNMVVGFMGGTTCTELARLLRPMENITVVTNALNIPLELQGSFNKRVMVTGGIQNQNSYELIGNQVIEILQGVHLSLAFIGATGISFNHGFCIDDETEAAVARAFMEAADRTIILADHTKIGKATFARLCPISGPDLLITDNKVTDKQLELFNDAGLKVMVANPVA